MRVCRVTIPGAGFQPGHPWPVVQPAALCHRHNGLVSPFADQIEQRVKDAQARVNQLTQSILAKAFRGELTAEWRAQHPELVTGEYSAEALLKRIKAEQADRKPQKRTCSKSTA